MAHLHETLAVETDQRKVAAQVREETTAVFKNKQELFVETVKELRYFDEDEAAKLNADEVVAMTTTVTEKLDWLREIQARYLDTYLQKEASNQNARADVILNDAVFLSDVPVTALLGMEKYLKDLNTKKNYYNDICGRCPQPASNVMFAMYDNLSEIIEKGAQGTLVEPTSPKKYGVEVLLKSKWVSNDFLTVTFPEEYKDNIKPKC